MILMMTREAVVDSGDLLDELRTLETLMGGPFAWFINHTQPPHVRHLRA